MNSSEPALTGEERAHVIRLLLESQNEFLNLISSLPDEQWTWKAAPGPWSVQQTAEHLVLGERAMLGMVEQALAGAPIRIGRNRTPARPNSSAACCPIAAI
jgi:hypothetical protein